MSKNKNNFLCRSCLSVMCSDCKEIAEEYAELLQMRNNESANLNREIIRLTEELNKERRKSSDLERISKLGLPALMIEYIDSEVGEGRSARLRRAARNLVLSLSRKDMEIISSEPIKYITEIGRILTEGER